MLIMNRTKLADRELPTYTKRSRWRRKKEGRKVESTSVGFVCSLSPTSTKRV